MKVIGIVGAAALLGLAGCASGEIRADASSHCEANISSRVLASDCSVTRTTSSRSTGKAQQRNPAVDAALRPSA